MKEMFPKKVFIRTAYQIIEKEGIDALSIRRLAKAIGCNLANLYRHFECQEELIVYASLKYMCDYVHEIQEKHEQSSSNLELYYIIYDCFSRYGFKYPEIFNHLLFGKYSGKLSQIMAEYYELFPEELENVPKEMLHIYMNMEFDYRDHMVLMECAKEGLIDPKDAEEVNRITTHLCIGYLREVIDGLHPDRDREELRQEFLHCIRSVVRPYLKENQK